VSGSIVQSAYNKDDSGATATTVAVTITGVTAGNHLVVHVGWQDSGSIGCTVSDGTSYSTGDSKRRDATQGQSGQVFYLENAGAGSHTVTATFGAPTAVGFRRIRVAEVSGLLTSSSIDKATGQSQTAAGTGTDSVTSGSTATTASANEFLMGFTQDTSELDPGSGTLSAGTNYTISGSNIILGLEGRSVSATGAYAATFTQSTNQDRITHIVTFKESGTASLEQEGYRFRNDDGSETTATWKANQDTDVNVSLNTAFRPRIIVNATNDPSSKKFLLQYRRSGAASWKDVRGPDTPPIPLPTSYTTSFPLNESPISEGVIWSNGLATGLDWNNVKTLGGIAFGAAISGGFDDCNAHLDPSDYNFAPDHQVTVTVVRAAAYTPGSSHEIELLLRFLITPHSARGYEITFPFANSTQVQVVAWNGALNDFTVLSGTQTNGGNIANGDSLSAKIVGNTITVYHNGVQVYTVSDTTWSSGSPGMGFFIRSGGTPESYCTTDWVGAAA
jgi:hypothetical protein